MKYKYELHCHTKNVSRCGKVRAKEIVKMYREKGYDGIVITDHYSPMTFPPSKILTPQSAIDYYMAGYREALEYADSDFTVLLGMELRYYATANDFLVYGVSEKFLRESGNLLSLYPRRFYNLAKKNDLIVTQAHPFREWMVRINPAYLDGAEVFNGKTKKEQNDEAKAWLEKNNMSIKISGSDFHRPAHLAKGGILTDVPIKNNDDLLYVLRSGKYDLIEEY